MYRMHLNVQYDAIQCCEVSVPLLDFIFTHLMKSSFKNCVLRLLWLLCLMIWNIVTDEKKEKRDSGSGQILSHNTVCLCCYSGTSIYMSNCKIVNRNKMQWFANLINPHLIHNRIWKQYGTFKLRKKMILAAYQSWVFISCSLHDVPIAFCWWKVWTAGKIPRKKWKNLNMFYIKVAN